MSLELHSLRPAAGSRRKKKRIGRGNASGHGTYSTRGMKGQRARSGGRAGLKKLGMKRIIAALPKLGGFTSLHVHPATVLLARLERHMKAGETVTLKLLKQRALVPADATAAKVVQTGTISKALTIGAGVTCSSGARAAIERAGGSVAA